MRRTRDEWAKIIESYYASGLTVRHFCQRAGVAEQSLRNWISRIDSGTIPAQAKGHEFIEVGQVDQVPQLVAAGAAASDSLIGLTLRLPRGIELDVHFNNDRRALDWVVDLLGNLS
jgi:hypothetical protein